MTICYTVPGIWHMADVIIFHFGLWCVADVIVIFHFGLFFALLPKNQNFKKMKKTPGDIMILHMCTKNHDHILYCSWDMERARCNYFSFCAIVCDRCNCYFWFWAILGHLGQKINFKKMKKTPGDITILHICTKNYDMVHKRKKWHTEVGAPPKNQPQNFPLTRLCWN